MNTTILNTDVQQFINAHLNTDITSLLLKGISFKDIDTKAIIEQIEAKKRCKTKLPTWFNTNTIYYPNKLNIEQTSSEKTAAYKAGLISGNTLIDLTGGFGIDAYYFSKRVETVTHCEINEELSKMVQHNNIKLGVANMTCIAENGIEVLKRLNKPFDWIYVDPSRRDVSKNKVFLLTDCEPNVKTFQGLFLKYAKHVMLKTSPLLDISATLSALKHVKCVHIVAVNNEVKELLWILERDYTGDVEINTINLQKDQQQNFNFKLKDESNSTSDYSEPLTYLYEPNAAILKAGAFNTVTKLSVQNSYVHKGFKIDEIQGFNLTLVISNTG